MFQVIKAHKVGMHNRVSIIHICKNAGKDLHPTVNNTTLAELNDNGSHIPVIV